MKKKFQLGGGSEGSGELKNKLLKKCWKKGGKNLFQSKKLLRKWTILAGEWLKGKNSSPVLLSMKTGANTKTFKVKAFRIRKLRAFKFHHMKKREFKNAFESFFSIVNLKLSYIYTWYLMTFYTRIIFKHTLNLNFLKIPIPSFFIYKNSNSI